MSHQPPSADVLDQLLIPLEIPLRLVCVTGESVGWRWRHPSGTWGASPPFDVIRRALLEGWVEYVERVYQPSELVLTARALAFLAPQQPFEPDPL